MSFILQPTTSSDLAVTKQTFTSAFQIPTGYRGIAQSSVTLSTTGPGSIQIPSGQFLQILQTN